MSIVHCLTLEQVENCQIHKMQEGSLLLLFCQHSTNADEYEYGAPVAIKERRDGESGYYTRNIESGYYTRRNIDVDIRVELSNYSTLSSAASQSSRAL